MLVLPDDIPSHPLQTSIKASVAPGALGQIGRGELVNQVAQAYLTTQRGLC
jgi:hypothetical protein